MRDDDIRIRLVIESSGACAVLVTRARGGTGLLRQAPHVERTLAASGLRFAGLSVATRRPDPAPDSAPLLPGETLTAAVRRLLARTPIVTTAP
jgi:hypothetical protein